MNGEQGSKGTFSTKTFKKRVVRLYFGSEDGILKLQREHPELFQVKRRVVVDSSPATGEVMKPDDQYSGDGIIEVQKNYIYSDNPVESDPIIGEDGLKLWHNNGLARLKAEEESSRINTDLQDKETDVYYLESTYIEEVDGLQNITRKQLEEDEKMILKEVKGGDFKSDDCAHVHYVSICDGQEMSTPLVMLHGIGGAIPAFHMLLSKQGPGGRYLFTNRRVYIIDMPGFGLSKREMEFIDEKTKKERNEKKIIQNEEERNKSLAKFDQNTADTCEKRMLEYIEKWRIEMKIDKMILFGHSFGGYISAAYAAKFPEQVEQLVLMEPWGIFSPNEYYCIDKNPFTYITSLKPSLKHQCWYFRSDPFHGFSHLGNYFGKLILKLFIMNKDEVYKLYKKNGCLNYLVNVHQMKERQNGLNAFCYISGFSFDYSITNIAIKDRLSALVKKYPHIRVLFLLGEKNYKDRNQDSQDSWFLDLCGCANLVKEKVADAGHHPNVENPKEVIELIFKHVYNQ